MNRNFNFLLLLAFFFTSAFNLNGQKLSKSDKTLAAEANVYFSNADYINALNNYKKIHQNNPEHPEINYSMGICFMNLGFDEEALPYLEFASQKGVKSKQLYYQLGKSYLAKLMVDSAIQSFEVHKKINNKNIDEFKKAERYIKYAQNAAELIKNPKKVTIKNLGPEVNSSFADYQPVLSADESIILYTSRRPNELHKQLDPRDNKYYEDIYINVRDYKKWTTPTPLGPVINSESHDACVGLSADGQQLIIYKPENAGDLYISSLLGNIWAEPIPLGSNVNSQYWEPCATISANQKYLIFVSDRPGGMGGTDLYLTKRLPSGTFGPAILLSDKVNTNENEFSPFLHPDGKTLYFSSMGHQSMGGYDIFKCTINPETGEILSPIENIGYPINTPNDDIFFFWTADNQRAYFSSIREGGQGDLDIYMMEVQGQNEAELSIVKGKVINCISKEPVKTEIIVKNFETKDELGTYHSNETTGKFLLALPAGIKYDITFEAKGYIYFTETRDINDNHYHEIDDTICIMSLNPGNKIFLKNIAFTEDGLNMNNETNLELDKLLRMLKLNDHIKINIKVHSDHAAGDKKGIEQTENRAKSIKDYLVKNGIITQRIQYRGMGGEKNIVPNSSIENKSINNRIEIEFN